MLDAVVAERWARMILACVHRQYPYHLVHVVASAADVRTPRELTPAFYGCFDWHSAVHGHWSLVRLLRLFPRALWATDVTQALAQSFTPENIAAEVDYQLPPSRAGFERPYGLAWLLQLTAELREVESAPFSEWATMLEPLETLAVQRLSEWLPKLAFPIRSGEHSQTAFAMSLCLDWAQVTKNRAFEELVSTRSRDWYATDRTAPLDYEPSAHDFLSPALGEADLMRRVLNAAEFAAWLGGYLPQLSGDAPVFEPVATADRADGKLAHFDGLNLSRAWMLEGIAHAVPPHDPRRPRLLAMAHAHSKAGLESVTGEHYAGAHWLGSFAIYLTTSRGTTP